MPIKLNKTCLISALHMQILCVSGIFLAALNFVEKYWKKFSVNIIKTTRREWDFYKWLF